MEGGNLIGKGLSLMGGVSSKNENKEGQEGQEASDSRNQNQEPKRNQKRNFGDRRILHGSKTGSGSRGLKKVHNFSVSWGKGGQNNSH